jgi:hypothetical protein
MTDFNPTPTPIANEPVRRVAVAPRAAMTTTGPIFTRMDLIAGIAAAVMNLGPLAMAAFVVGRY